VSSFSALTLLVGSYDL